MEDAKGIVVVGAGGHAKVCIEILHSMGRQVDFCVGGIDSSNTCVRIPVLKGDAHLEQLRAQGYSSVFVAIGSNSLRAKLADIATGLGYQLVNAVSPHAHLSPTARLGRGVAIMPGVVINAEVEIGDLAIINTGTTIDHDCVIGKTAHIAPQCGLAGCVTVGSMSFLGIGSKVIPGISVGEKVTLGAGAVVISNMNDGVTAVGVPARVLDK